MERGQRGFGAPPSKATLVPPPRKWLRVIIHDGDGRISAAMPNGRCKLHGGTEGLERSRRANWKHGHFSREAKAERSRLRAAILVLRDLRDSI